MADVLRIASQIATPIGLAGFVFAAIFLLLEQLVKANKIPQLSGAASVRLIDRLFLLAVLAMAFGFIASVYVKPKTLVYRGAVLDAVSGNTIANASVLILGRPEFYPVTTDAHGSFSLSTSSYESAIEVVPQVRHAQYRTWSENRRITEAPVIDLIRLSPAEESQPVTPSNQKPPVNPPEYDTRWIKVDDSDRTLAETFGPIRTENRHNRPDIIASGTRSLSHPTGRIYSVEYACDGYACGWSYNPNGGYGASVQISADGRSFTWFRRWDGDPALETYRALYEVPKQVCVKNCE